MFLLNFLLLGMIDIDDYFCSWLLYLRRLDWTFKKLMLFPLLMGTLWMFLLLMVGLLRYALIFLHANNWIKFLLLRLENNDSLISLLGNWGAQRCIREGNFKVQGTISSMLFTFHYFHCDAHEWHHICMYVYVHISFLLVLNQASNLPFCWHRKEFVFYIYPFCIYEPWVWLWG